jgi:cytochrome c-type biogenesis protein CcmE
MNALRKRRLIWILILSLSVVFSVFLVLAALGKNVNLFFSPSEIYAGQAKLGQRIRVGGMVEKGSLVRGKELQIQFSLSDFKHRLIIHYSGILPDLFKEGQGIVASGYLIRPDLFLADEVLAKHDENYMPPGAKL